MRILFTTIPEKGHLNPTIPVALELKSRGHSVAYLGSSSLKPQLANVGLDLLQVRTPKLESTEELITSGAEFCARLQDKNWLRAWVTSLLLDGVEERVPLVGDALTQHQADIVVTDPMLYDCVLAAHVTNTPWVALSNSLNPALPSRENSSLTSDLLDTVDLLSDRRHNLFSRFDYANCRFSGCDALSPYLTTCFSVPEFVGKTTSGIKLVGACLPKQTRGDEAEFPFERLKPECRKVYISFGSQINHQPALMQKLINAIERDMTLQAIIMAGDLAYTGQLEHSSEQTILCSYVPQLALLPHIDCFITHGGANSVMEALSHGVPLMINPICNDQFHQAWFLQRAQLGTTVHLNSMSVDEIYQALLQMLNDNELRGRIALMRQHFHTDGALIAATFIEELHNHVD